MGFLGEEQFYRKGFCPKCMSGLDVVTFVGSKDYLLKCIKCEWQRLFRAQAKFKQDGERDLKIFSNEKLWFLREPKRF